jgi:hypothetical protein
MTSKAASPPVLFLAELGGRPLGEFAAFLRSEIPKWGGVIRLKLAGRVDWIELSWSNRVF